MSWESPKYDVICVKTSETSKATETVAKLMKLAKFMKLSKLVNKNVEIYNELQTSFRTY